MLPLCHFGDGHGVMIAGMAGVDPGYFMVTGRYY
ncbi:Uncharacterised protein [Serratia quinivorans]|nr:Uncharacterised protein [Serratia quinivorans]CAI1521809.1 Uncharacterised protein [Serratia quinivorans]